MCGGQNMMARCAKRARAPLNSERSGGSCRFSGYKVQLRRLKAQVTAHQHFISLPRTALVGAWAAMWGSYIF